MCNLSQGVWDDGKIEGIAGCITYLTAGNNISIEDAMNMLGVADSLRPAVVDALKNAQVKAVE